MNSTAESIVTMQEPSSSLSQEPDDDEILRDYPGKEESFTSEISSFICKNESDIVEETPENENNVEVFPKSPLKKKEDLRLYPVKSRKKLSLDSLVPFLADSSPDKDQRHCISKLNEGCFLSKSLNRDSLPTIKSQENITERKDVSREVQIQMQDSNFGRAPLREVLLQTPVVDRMPSFQSSTFSTSKKFDGDNITSSGATPPAMLGSTISGISTLSYTSSDIKSDNSQPKRAIPKTNEHEESIILTSTPRHTDKVFDWEEISNVTDGLSDCSSLKPLRKNSKFTCSSDLQFSDFSQSQESNGSNSDPIMGEKRDDAGLNSSQELSGSDKENIEPDGNKIEIKGMRILPPTLIHYVAPNNICTVERQTSSQPLVSKRRRHWSCEDDRQSLSQPNSFGVGEIYHIEKRIKVDAGLDCDENDFSLS